MLKWVIRSFQYCLELRSKLDFCHLTIIEWGWVLWRVVECYPPRILESWRDRARLVRGVVIDFSGPEEGYGLFLFRFGEGHNFSGVCFNSEFWKDVRDRRAYKFMLVVTSHYCSLVSAVIITSVSFRHSKKNLFSEVHVFLLDSRFPSLFKIF